VRACVRAMVRAYVLCMRFFVLLYITWVYKMHVCLWNTNYCWFVYVPRV